MLFIILVVLGFLFHFLATWPVTPFATRIAWGCWLVASILWALPSAGA